MSIYSRGSGERRIEEGFAAREVVSVCPDMATGCGIIDTVVGGRHCLRSWKSFSFFVIMHALAFSNESPIQFSYKNCSVMSLLASSIEP